MLPKLRIAPLLTETVESQIEPPRPANPLTSPESLGLYDAPRGRSPFGLPQGDTGVADFADFEAAVAALRLQQSEAAAEALVPAGAQPAGADAVPPFDPTGSGPARTPLTLITPSADAHLPGTGEAPRLSRRERSRRAVLERQARMAETRLAAARMGRLTAERSALEEAEAFALDEARKLADCEAAARDAALAAERARSQAEHLAHLEAQARARLTEQHTRTVQARLAARALRQRQQAINRQTPPVEPETDFASTMILDRGAGEAAAGAETVPMDLDGAPAHLAPAVQRPPVPSALATAAARPGGLPILTVVPADTLPWADAANRPRMGKVLIEGHRMTPVDVEVVLMHQSAERKRFGEIAVSLGLLEVADVVWALRRQRPEGRPLAPGADPAGVIARASVPALPVLTLRDRPQSPAAQVLRGIAGQVLQAVAQSPRRTVGVVSPGVGDGRSTVAANLALAMAEQGRRVLLLDTDLARSRLALLLPGVEISKGLSGVMSGRQRLADAIVKPQMAADKPFYVLPAGEHLGDPAELARLRSFTKLLDNVATHFDCVLIDTPATTLGPAALMICALAGPALVVARPGHTRNAALDQLTADLRRSATPVLGVVMNSH